MLTVTIWANEKRDKVITSVKDTFRDLYKTEWFDDPQALQWVKDIDKMDHIEGDVFRDRWGKAAPPDYLSSGSKALFLMKFQDEYKVYATRCGDNCIPYIEDIANKKDLHIVLHHCMHFSEGYPIYITDSNQTVKGGIEWVYEFYRIVDEKLNI